jgi:hypothetical protein
MKNIILFVVIIFPFVCQSQTDTVLKMDSSKFVLTFNDFHSSQDTKDNLSYISFDWRKMSSPGNFFQDPVSVRRMLLNRFDPTYETMFIYNDHSYYFDNPFQPYGRNDIPSVLILGALDYFFQWLDEK